MRFVADNHLGQLAYYLRMLGFDTLYRNDYQDDELAQTADVQERILLTRDRRLLMRNQVQRGYWVRSLSPRQQILEVVRRYNLTAQITPSGAASAATGSCSRSAKRRCWIVWSR